MDYLIHGLGIGLCAAAAVTSFTIVFGALCIVGRLIELFVKGTGDEDDETE